MPNSYQHFLEIELNDQDLKQQEDACNGTESQQADDFFRDFEFNSEEFVPQQEDKGSQRTDDFFLDLDLNSENLEQQEANKERQASEDFFLDLDINDEDLKQQEADKESQETVDFFLGLDINGEGLEQHQADKEPQDADDFFLGLDINSVGVEQQKADTEPQERDPEVNLKKRKIECLKKVEDNNEPTKRPVPAYWLPKAHKKRMEENIFELNKEKHIPSESQKHKMHMKKFMFKFKNDRDIPNRETNNADLTKKPNQPVESVMKYDAIKRGRKKSVPQHHYMFHFMNNQKEGEHTPPQKDAQIQPSFPVSKP